MAFNLSKVQPIVEVPTGKHSGFVTDVTFNKSYNGNQTMYIEFTLDGYDRKLYIRQSMVGQDAERYAVKKLRDLGIDTSVHGEEEDIKRELPGTPVVVQVLRAPSAQDPTRVYSNIQEAWAVTV